MTTNTDKQNQIRDLVERTGAKFASVTFIKKSGEARTLNFNPRAAAPRVKGEAASAQAQQAAKTRAENNPNLLNVWAQNASGGEPQFRSVNMDTVTMFKAGGETITF